MMGEVLCRGLSANWLNAWLAGIGVTAICPDVKLRWEAEVAPQAVVVSNCSTLDELAHKIAQRFPTEEGYLRTPIHKIPRQVDATEYAIRAQEERGLNSWELAASVTDLTSDSKGRQKFQHGPFDPAAPGTTGSVYDRLVACRAVLPEQSTELVGWVMRSLQGAGVRVERNGLGFDSRRLDTAVLPDSKKAVDPVIEILAHQALRILPVRGDGRQMRARGWLGRASSRGAFVWPTWFEPLDLWGIDALLDRYWASRSHGVLRTNRLWGVGAAYQSVPYQPRDSRHDRTRAYGAEPLQ